MARGFESKQVADQQAEADIWKASSEEGAPVVSQKKRRLELARADVLQRLRTAPEGGYRQMLSTALADLEREIATLH